MGQATVDVIQSCMPNIKNAWAYTSIRTGQDAILVAIEEQVALKTIEATISQNANVRKIRRL